jgi:hypothetical protein
MRPSAATSGTTLGEGPAALSWAERADVTGFLLTEKYMLYNLHQNTWVLFNTSLTQPVISLHLLHLNIYHYVHKISWLDYTELV